MSKQDKILERLERARSSKKNSINKIPTAESDSELSRNTTVFGDLEVGGVTLNDNIIEKDDIIVNFQDDSSNTRKYIDRRGAKNRFERALVKIGQKCGVTVIFEG